MKHMHRAALLALIAALPVAGAHAQKVKPQTAPAASQTLQIANVSPQGEVAEIRQVVVKFKSDAVRFGDPQAAAPFTLQCNKKQKGQGRWTSAREWVFDFADDLPAGVTCKLTSQPRFKSPAGQALPASNFSFSTGGPAVRQIRPPTWRNVEEEQSFVLHLSGPATAESVQANVWCRLDGVGERVPVRLLQGDERQALIKAAGLQKVAARDDATLVALQCQRRFSAGSDVQLVYGKGVSTPDGLVNTREKSFEFSVRKPFTASISCERENAQAACMPIRPVTLELSSDVPRRVLDNARLQTSQGEIKPAPDEDSTPDSLVNHIKFDAPLPENDTLKLTLPADLRDASGRVLDNAASFPMTLRTAAMPPLAKFAAAPFGIIERFAEGEKTIPMLPVTLRRVEGNLSAQAMNVSRLQTDSDTEIISWMRRIETFDNSMVSRKLASPVARTALPPPTEDMGKDYVESRAVSLLAGLGGVQTQALPQAEKGDSRPLEVVGIPLEPGFHVLEIASQQLGKSLLTDEYGPQRTMYVRTAALVTNLGVHFKYSGQGSLAWVTTLDKGQPVAGASVRVSSCDGKTLAEAVTDAQGVARLDTITARAPECKNIDSSTDSPGYFISARSHGDDGQTDMAFVWSEWQKGIEPWRFNVLTGSYYNSAKTVLAHTVLDRTLVRAGETVSMKHYVRMPVSPEKGTLAIPPSKQLPASLTITHVGSGQEFKTPLKWVDTPTGGRYALSQFAVPAAAKLGVYEISMPGLDTTGQFRVEEFRLPVLQGQMGVPDKNALINASSLPVQVQMSYVAGGAASGLPMQVSALLRERDLQFSDYEEFSFQAPSQPQQSSSSSEEEEDEDSAQSEQRLVLDKAELKLDAQGAGQLTLDRLPPSLRPRQLRLEATYADPNGEIQTLSSTQNLWPAAVIAGVRADDWVSVGRKLQVQALALGLDGKPKAGAKVSIKALAHVTQTTRKRLVGGFYAYDHHHETHDLGTVCSGSSDELGLLTCKADLTRPGRVELVASVADEAGRHMQAAVNVWVTRQGELWFDGENHDRIDVLPERKEYQAGETARFQVRMPFRKATALVAVEREGVVQTQVLELSGDDPTISLKVQPEWAPNVYVSVLALRGRLHEVPWYSFFTWGFKSPIEWWKAFRAKDETYTAPTALVDLSKPTWRFGVGEIRVDAQAHRMHVGVEADKPSYAPRATARVRVQAKLPNGQPAAGAQVALAVVDKALLELMPNRSWNLLEAMLQRRAWGVETATAQMEIVGRRHYGRKAAPAGGDGAGGAPVRELLDTLLLWKPDITLDAQGQASVDVPLNDALTTFQVVAIADSGAQMFGTGKAALRVTQDLQIISGLPPLVRAGDSYDASVTLRNTTEQPMKVTVQAQAQPLKTEPQTLQIAPGQASQATWRVTAPDTLAATGESQIQWQISARAEGGAQDALKINQRVLPAVPVTVQQATLVQLEGNGAAYSLPVSRPASALPGQGGVALAVQASLADGLPAVHDWFQRYPYSCLEQKTSKAIGMRDLAQWQAVADALPAYLDSDGLAHYFPPASGNSHSGSPILTAWLLAATHEASRINPGYALPEDARKHMLAGLAAFVEGRIERRHWAPRADLNMRKIAAIEALSRYGAARPAMLSSVQIELANWPSSAVIQWASALRRIKGVPNQAALLEEAMQTLRARLSWQGTRLVFSTEESDNWWWLMDGGDVNTARLLLTVLDDPAWQDDLGRIVSGFIQRQKGGAWQTTTANLWGSLALERFASARESGPVSGRTQARLGKAQGQIDWAQVRPASAEDAAGRDTRVPVQYVNNTAMLPWGSGSGELQVTHEGTGRPWLTVQSLAAVPLEAPFAAGYQISKTVTALEQADKNLPEGHYSRGDVLRVQLRIKAGSDMSWVAISDPVPGGATILGSGLGRDSAIATQGERREGATYWLAYEERSFEAWRSYYEYLPKGEITVEYTVRLNNPGVFKLPPTRVEALYAPEMYGLLPNAPVQVQ